MNTPNPVTEQPSVILNLSAEALDAISDLRSKDTGLADGLCKGISEITMYLIGESSLGELNIPHQNRLQTLAFLHNLIGTLSK